MKEEKSQISQDIARLVTKIEENLRASPTAGLQFVDPRHLKGQVSSKQHHVVFGRRGAGKSTFVSSLAGKPECVAVSINLEIYKDYTFPNIILYVLKDVFDHLIKDSCVRNPIYKLNFGAISTRQVLKKAIKRIQSEIDAADEERIDHSVKVRSDNTVSGKFGGGSLGGSATRGDQREEATSRTIRYDKKEKLLKTLPSYRESLSSYLRTVDVPVFLILDDFYFVPKSIQPEFVDYFHRLVKGMNVYLKIATIKHRSKLYRQTSDSIIGVEVGQDVHEIDMDYTLDRFSELKEFMSQILDSVIQDCDLSLTRDDLFAGDGFEQLCLASGGVPRDFLSLFVRWFRSSSERLGKIGVTDTAISAVSNKLESMHSDSAEEREILDAYLRYIKNTVYEKHRTNCFLVSKAEMETRTEGRQAIRELSDLRLIHLVDFNTSSAPSDGRTYEAYILDVGLYNNSRPRNFRQVNPGQFDEKSRRDEVRSSPKLSLEKLEQAVSSSAAKLQL